MRRSPSITRDAVSAEQGPSGSPTANPTGGPANLAVHSPTFPAASIPTHDRAGSRDESLENRTSRSRSVVRRHHRRDAVDGELADPARRRIVGGQLPAADVDRRHDAAAWPPRPGRRSRSPPTTAAGPPPAAARWPPPGRAACWRTASRATLRSTATIALKRLAGRASVSEPWRRGDAAARAPARRGP